MNPQNQNSMAIIFLNIKLADSSLSYRVKITQHTGQESDLVMPLSSMSAS